ncbi:MAG: hypothetical protein V2A73_18865, partial [Pseudomonadota bacterium]
SAGTRRVIPVAAAVVGLGPGASEVLDKLTQARLFTVRRTAEGGRRQAEREGKGRGSDGEAVLELVHESLVRTWGRLARWVEESHEELVVLAEISQAAELWAKRGRRDEEVWQGDALADARRKLARLSTKVPEHVAEFLKASLRKENRQRQRKRALAIGVMALLAVIAVVSLLRERETRVQKERAESERAEAQTQRAEAQREGSRAALGRGGLLEARAKLRGSLETQDSLLGRGLWWRLERDPLAWRRTLGDQVYAVAFSPDGATVAATAIDRLVYLFDTETQQVRFLRGPDGHASVSLAFAPDGKQLAVGAWSGAIVLWNLEEGTTRLLVGHSSLVYGLAFSVDGRLLASGSEDRTVRVWDTATARSIRDMAGHASRVWCVAFSPDGLLLAAGMSGGPVRVWSVANWTERMVLAGSGGLAFAPDGGVLASGSSDGSIVLWDVASGGRQRSVLRGHERGVFSLDISKDGQTMVSSSPDRSVRVWDLASGVERNAFLGAQDEAMSVSLSPDGALVASGSRDKNIRLWRVATRPEDRAAGHEAVVYRVAISPDGRHLATGGTDRTVRVWEVASGAQLLSLAGSAGEVRGVAVSPDGRSLASGGSDCNIRVWDLESPGNPRVFSGHHGPVDGMDFSPDGKTLASASSDRSIRLWDLATGKEQHVLAGHSASVADVAFSSDGRLVASGSYDGTVRIWDAQTGAQRQVLAGHRDLVWGVGFAPNGKRLASASWDRTVRLWDLATGTSRVFGDHTGHVYSVAFHPDGRHLGTTDDAAARIWDLATASATVLRGHGPGGVTAIRFTLDGTTAATTGKDGTVRLWDARTAMPVWRAPILFRPSPILGERGGAPEAYTHRGWIRLDISASRQPIAVSSGLPIDDEAGRPMVDAALPGRFDSVSTKWRRAVEIQAAMGSAAQVPGASDLLCLRTYDERLQAWDATSDRVVVDRPVPGIEEILAIPSGCAAIAGGRVYIFDVRTLSSAELDIGSGRATAFAWGGGNGDNCRNGGKTGGILVAVGNEVLLFDEQGVKTGSFKADVGQTAVGCVRGSVVSGFEDGNIQLLQQDTDTAAERGHQRATPSFAFEGVPASAVSRIIEGPPGTLIAGHASGFVGIWNLENGALLDSAKLHGPVVHLLLDRRAAASPRRPPIERSSTGPPPRYALLDRRAAASPRRPVDDGTRWSSSGPLLGGESCANELIAVTELGDYLVWDLGAFYRDYCELLDDIWSKVPIVWQAGLPAFAPPPTWHRCAAAQTRVPWPRTHRVMP